MTGLQMEYIQLFFRQFIADQLCKMIFIFVILEKKITKSSLI